MLKAGFSRVDVTPPLGSYVAGVFYPRFAKEVLDPIELNAIALSDGEETALIIAADFLMIGRKYADIIKDIISEKTGVPVTNIMIPCLHQHTSIKIAEMPQGILEDKAYIDVLYRKFADVATMAINDMEEAQLFYGQEETEEELSFVRRYIMNDGSVATNPGGDLRKQIAKRYAEADQNVRLCRFKRETKNDIALVNFSTHADLIHKELFSFDWPGFVRTYVEADIEGASCIAVTGAEGDTNHVDFMADKIKNGYDHCKHMARIITNTVLKMWENLTPCEGDEFVSKQDIVYNKTRTDGEERYEESVKLRDAIRAKTAPHDITKAGEATRIIAIREAPIYQKIPVSVLRIGNVGFVGFGGEPFIAYAEAVRNANPDKFIICSCCTNGGEGYLPTAKAFEEGGYEASASLFSPNIEEQCVNMAIKLLNE